LLDLKTHAYHALPVRFDEIGATFFAFFGDAGVARFPRFRAGAARLALRLRFRGVGGCGGGDGVDLGGFRGHIDTNISRGDEKVQSSSFM